MEEDQQNLPQPSTALRKDTKIADIDVITSLASVCCWKVRVRYRTAIQ
jgi:hypothetical protein